MVSDEQVETFTSVTGAAPDVARKFLQMTKGDIDQAINLFFSQHEDETEDISDRDSLPDELPTTPSSSPAESQSAVDSILESLKTREDRGGGSDSEKGSGKGSGKGTGSGGSSRPSRNVIIVFFAEGFMVDEDVEPPEPAAEETQAPAPAPRRTGMMGLNDLKKDAKARGPMRKLPKLKPLRLYDTPENRTFIAEIKANRVPPELLKKDESGAPIPISIGLEDCRPRTYAEFDKHLKMLQQEMDGDQPEPAASNKPSGPALFTGAGNTLSSGSSAAAAAGSTGAAKTGTNADPALLALVASGARPEVDESKPVATLQLRLSTGARVKVRLNHDHTVADLWRLVSLEMGAEAFRAASQHQLVAGFPPKPLTDNAMTLAAADLVNAAVTHRCQ